MSPLSVLKHTDMCAALCWLLLGNSLVWPEQGAGLAFLVSLLERLALVVLPFALTNRNAELDVTAARKEFEWYDSAPLLLCGYQCIDLAALSEQFTAACLICLGNRYAMCAVDGAIEQVQLTVFNGYIGAAQLAVPHTQAFYFGAS